MREARKKEEIEVSAEELEELKRLIDASSFPDKYKKILIELLNRIRDVHRTSQERKAELKKIRRMLGCSTEKSKKAGREDGEPAGETETPPGHGRIPADSYRTETVTVHPHQLETGTRCPGCESGNLNEVESRKLIRLKGNALVTAELHQPEVLRCSTCGKEFVAEMKDDEGGKLTSSANAAVAVARFGFGIPNWRLAKMQAANGVPLPASTQHDMQEMAFLDCAPVWLFLLGLAANGTLFHADDTFGRILSLMANKAERKARGERVGIYTTGIVAMSEGHEIHLFFTGPRYAGENLDRLLENRDPEQPVAQVMADASAMNIPKLHTIRLFLCLTHGRRGVFDCLEQFPDECAFVIDRIARVYEHDRMAKEAIMGPEERLAFHRGKSAPLMEEIHAHAKRLLESRAVEPNSVLGGAFGYLLKFWDGLTQFLRVPGAPLDNNIAERLLKKMILCRKNSLFYKTENGARIGDGLMSLIHTTIAAGENPFEYLTLLQRYSKQVAAHPELWLPWNFRKIIKSVQT